MHNKFRKEVENMKKSDKNFRYSTRIEIKLNKRNKIKEIGETKKEKDKNSGRENKTIEDMFKEENKTKNTNNIMDLC